MKTGRLEAFTDGVVAIAITIMVLELKVPEDGSLAALAERIPILLAYVLSFINIGLYWNNHHHLLQATTRIDGRVLWANLFLLFWLSLVPFVTAWMGEHPLAGGPVALYGADMLMCAVSYTILATMLTRHEGADSQLARAIGRDIKGKISLGLYTIAVVTAAVAPAVALGLYVTVAAIWFIPDRRIERTLGT